MGYQPHPLGSGPLTARRVIDDALGMLRQSLWRIVGVAAIFFVLPAVLATLAEIAIHSLETGHSLALVFAAATIVATIGLRVLGPVAFAGFLDEGVAREYQHGRHRSLREVIETLPWLRLIAVDLVVATGTVIGVTLLLAPGLIFYGLFGMVGPVVVRERAGVIDSLRRTMRLSMSAPRLVIVLVLVPTTFEHVFRELLFEALHSSSIGIQVVADWLVAALIGSAVGLMEVALATELMARNPRPADPGAGDVRDRARAADAK